MFHQPVLLQEILKFLEPKSGENFIDCTMGGGGHLVPLLRSVLPNGRVLGIDLDPTAQRAISKKIPRSCRGNVILVQGSFRNLKQIVKKHHFHNVRGILFDLGVSSHQLESADRGFGFSSDRLDMRFNPEQKLTAHDIINHWKKEELIDIFQKYGEEPLAVPIAEAIIRERRMKPVQKPDQLVKIISAIYRRHYKTRSRRNPATRVFQALRIAVNDELSALEEGLVQAKEIVEPGGRIAVISYHSLEDRIVKHFFKTMIPITKKPCVPSQEEIQANPRSRSAKLRVAGKISHDV